MIIAMILATMVQILAPWTYVIKPDSSNLLGVLNITQSLFYFVNLIYSCLLLYVFFIFG